jgi:hypothetical protein
MKMMMTKRSLMLSGALILLFLAVTILPVTAIQPSPQLVVAVYSVDGTVTVTATDGDATGYKLLGFKWQGTANYYVNPKNKYGLSTTLVSQALQVSANTWDEATSGSVFTYSGATTKTAGKYDGYNVVSWGSYQKSAIAVTYIWHIGNTIVETDTMMNTYYKWSLTGQAGKMDVANIMTHEFGHWCGLADLYVTATDYWLTMYGYATTGETYKRTLATGDIDGLNAVYLP